MMPNRSITLNYSNFEKIDKIRSKTQIRNHENTSNIDSTPEQIDERIESNSSATDDEVNVFYKGKSKNAKFDI